MMQSVTRKTISFPAELEREIAKEAANERRRFSPHVVKVLEGIFLASNCQTVKRKRGK